VASLNRRDEFHEWAKAQMAVLPPPMLTCDAVLTEACYLLRDARGGSGRVLDLVEREVIKPRFRIETDAFHLKKLMAKYSDVPMSLADACLVRMSEQHPDCAVMTLDSDFRRYRRRGRQTIPLLIPPGR